MNTLRYSHIMESYMTVKMKNLLLHVNNTNESHRLNFEWKTARHKTMYSMITSIWGLYTSFHLYEISYTKLKYDNRAQNSIYLQECQLEGAMTRLLRCKKCSVSWFGRWLYECIYVWEFINPFIWYLCYLYRVAVP